jgi:hypothetical protein
MDWRLKYNTAHIHPADLNKHFDLNLGFVCFLSVKCFYEVKCSPFMDSVSKARRF